MTFHQRPWDRRMEPFVGRAILNRPPSFFENECGIIFTEGLDELDFYKGALLEHDSMTRVVLKQYRGSNPNWTSIYLDPDLQDYSEISNIILSVLDELGLQLGDVVWKLEEKQQ